VREILCLEIFAKPLFAISTYCETSEPHLRVKIILFLHRLINDYVFLDDPYPSYKGDRGGDGIMQVHFSPLLTE
jgi:hypothetical protein